MLLFPHCCLRRSATSPPSLLANHLRAAGTKATPLHFAADAQAVEALVKAGGLVNTRRADLRTPLHTARSRPVVAALLANGARPTAADKHQLRPLHLADSWPVAEALLQAGAPVGATNSQGQTVLHLVVLEALRSADSDGDGVDDEDGAGDEAREAVYTLVAKLAGWPKGGGQLVTKRDSAGKTPRDLAAEAGDSAVAVRLRQLLE
eukprot:SAG22_NODE_1729_length_3709_cov_2.780055_2_plen_206_part_00